MARAGVSGGTWLDIWLPGLVAPALAALAGQAGQAGPALNAYYTLQALGACGASVSFRTSSKAASHCGKCAASTFCARRCAIMGEPS